MWIKICGNQTLADLQPSIADAADAVGFVFAPSIRRVNMAQISEIMPTLPDDVTAVGVFNTQNFDEIRSALRSGGLHGVQLHGELDFALAEKLRREFGAGLFLIQTLHWDLTRDPARAEETLRNELRAIGRHNDIDAVLLDSRNASASGGTGQPLDWERARDVTGAEAGNMRIILAGGLNPQNVAQAIQTVKPWGVDVSSGVEQYPGKKDPARVRAFIEAARTAFAAIENKHLVPQ
ncbi:MAG: phosphoribosylanthranilate isomerase [Acidobacteriota bacterium]